MTKLQERLKVAFNTCYRLCESDRRAEDWFARAFDEAKAGEKRHRGSDTSRFTLPVTDAARFFAVKWFLDTMGPPLSHADACGMRPDCLYALAARDRVRSDKTKNETWHRLYAEFQDIRELDYVKEFTK